MRGAKELGGRLGARPHSFCSCYIVRCSVVSNAQPSRLSHQVVKDIKATAEEWRLFYRVLPYFDGRHSLEEIMWQENLGRGRLAQLLAVFTVVIRELVY